MENTSYKILKKKKKEGKVIRQKDDPKKDEVIKEIIELFDNQGVKVRREKLGQGVGWKAISGACIVKEENTLFLDRRLEQDEQILFLVDKLIEGKFTINPEIIEKLPQKVRKVVGL